MHNELSLVFISFFSCLFFFFFFLILLLSMLVLAKSNVNFCWSI